MRAVRLATLATAAAALLALSAPPADAQATRRYPYPGEAPRQVDDQREAYDSGYREGMTYGERDARERRDLDYRRHRAYRDATGGYRYGDRDDYRNAYRRGFETGYRTGYSRSGYGRPSYGYPGYPPSGGYYPDYGGSGSYGRPGYGSSVAFENGLQDGYREGLDAARDGNRYDPVSERRYRDADRGYNKRYGHKDYYRDEYREGFRSGYDRGYREARSYGSRPWNGWPW